MFMGMLQGYKKKNFQLLSNPVRIDHRMLYQNSNSTIELELFYALLLFLTFSSNHAKMCRQNLTLYNKC